MLLETENEDHAANLRIAIFGLGYVGTSIAATWLRAGASVEGYDVSADRVRILSHPGSIRSEQAVEQAFERGLASGKLSLHTVDQAPVKTDADVKIVCVPVYLAEKSKHADLTFLKSAVTSVGTALKKGDAVVICPSVPPGTTRKVVAPILESVGGLSSQKGEFDLIYSPERILVGRAVEDIETRYPAIIAGINEQSLARAETLFLTIAQKGVIKMPNLETAEFEKLAEGVYRDVNIALANELAMACDELGVNFWSVREAANSQPFCHLHVPGLGVGGACIPVYPWFIAKSVEKTETTIIEDSRSINDAMVQYLVTSLIQNFKANGETRIAVLGLSFRAEIADSRLSVTYRLVDELRARGLNKIKVHDPLIQSDLRLGGVLSGDLKEVLREADIAIIATDHKSYSDIPWHSIRSGGRKLKVIDTKGLLLNRKVEGIEVYGLGYGEKSNPEMREVAS